MKFKKGNIVKVNDKLGVVIDTEYMNQNTIRVATFKNPSYWGDDYNKDNVIYIMQGHPDLADQIRNMNSIEECINENLIYESMPKHNVVFVGLDNNKNPKYAFFRGTNKTRFMGEAKGSDKKYSFKLEAKNECNRIHLFESAIDLLSYATL